MDRSETAELADELLELASATFLLGLRALFETESECSILIFFDFSADRFDSDFEDRNSNFVFVFVLLRCETTIFGANVFLSGAKRSFVIAAFPRFGE